MSEPAPVKHPVKLGGIHHTAYRCKDAKETVEWYGRVLGMDYTTAFAEDHVPSTGEYDPYMHVFLDAGNGNVLAFFELPNQKDMGRDENTPAWVQHLALRVGSEAELLAAKGITVARTDIGAYFTSQEMAGFSITLMRLDDEIIDLLDAPCKSVPFTQG